MSNSRNQRQRMQPSKAALLDRMPRAFRPKLDAGQVRDLALCHIVNLDAIASGKAEAGILWDWISTSLTWVRTAQLMGLHVPALAAQLDVATRLVERYGRTGRVGFDGPDYQLAKAGVVAMDELALLVDKATAVQAVGWAAVEVDTMAALVTEFQARPVAAPSTPMGAA